MVTIRRSETAGEAAVAQRPGQARPWERTGAVDVEALLVWAYADQQVDRFLDSGMHVIELEAMGGAMGWEPHGASTDGCASLERIAMVGARISGSVSIYDNVHPVAYAVAASVRAVARGTTVIAHALAGSRPEGWVRPARMFRPEVWVRQGIEGQVSYLGPGKKGAHCPIIVLWSPEREAWGRADYAAWRQALEAVAWDLGQRALGFAVTGPAAPAEPWLDAKSDGARPISLDGEAEAGGAPMGPPSAPQTEWGAAARDGAV